MTGFRWYDLGDGRQVYRKALEPRAERSSLPCPMLIRPFTQPLQSAADGKWYDNPRDLSRSHRASGNPHGIDFIELGNEALPWVEHKTDERQLRDDVRAAKADVEAGKLPHVVTLDD